MNDSPTSLKKLRQEMLTLRQQLVQTQERLNETEETLQAIRSGEVDAVVVSTPQGARVFTLQGADYVYQCLIEQMGEGAATVSADGLILYCNKRLSELLDCPLKNLIGSQLESFISPKDRSEFLLLLQEVQEQEMVIRELSLISATGNKEVPIHLSLKQFKIDQLLVNSIIITDVTEFKIKEAAKLSQILNSAIVVIKNFRVLPDGTVKIDSWTGGTQQIFGYSLEALQADSDLVMTNILLDDRQKMLISLVENIQAGRSGIIEYRFLHSDRQIHWLLSNYVAEWNPEQDAWMGIEIITDITEKKKLEQQFYHAQRLESLGTLASGISHDFNNILTPILGVTQLLTVKFPNLDDKTKRLLTILTSSARRGADLVKQILLFSRAANGEYLILQLGYILLELISIAKQTFPKSIVISADISTRKLWTILADATQMHQVFMNLMINARDAMPDGGTLTISAENRQLDEHDALINLEAKAGSYVVVTLADQGIGIAPELLNKIFDPFFTTKEVGKGTGLGLSTVIGIVKNHGGFVRVYSELGKGSEFKIFLPAIQGEVSVIPLEKSMPSGKGELILIVDDDASIREVTKISLETYNYRAILASDGIGAIAFYAKYQAEISVVLMDMMMPNLDGATTISTLQSLNPLIKIIATSGLFENKKLAFDAGVKTFLLKPYTIRQLLQLLIDLLSPDQELSEDIPPILSQESPMELSKETLAIMSPQWLQQMRQAAYYCDQDLLMELITQIPSSQEAIVKVLQDLILNFKMDIIIGLTDAASQAVM
jgi:PAS domain S-box-containing protein